MNLILPGGFEVFRCSWDQVVSCLLRLHDSAVLVILRHTTFQVILWSRIVHEHDLKSLYESSVRFDIYHGSCLGEDGLVSCMKC